MEQQILTILKLGLDLDDFYSIMINPNSFIYSISFQGTLTPELLLKYTSKGYVFEIDGNRYYAKKDNHQITLMKNL